MGASEDRRREFIRSHKSNDMNEDLEKRILQNKLKIMVEPLDLPVTRIMTVDQMQRFMEDVQKYVGELYNLVDFK